MSKRIYLAASIAFALSSSVANAASSVDEMFSIRGYGTLGVVHSDNDKADFVFNKGTQTKGAGYSDDWSLDVDSKAGLQIDARFTDRLKAVVQLVSEASRNNTWDGDYNEDYNPSLEWANLSYRITDSLTVRGGRIVLPFLMTVEYGKVGYSNHWIRSPMSLNFTSSDGADVSYTSQIGSVKNTARAYYGVSTLRTSAALKGQVTQRGLTETVEFGAWTLRAAFLDLELDRAHTHVVTTRSLYDVGAQYDPGPWFAMGEFYTQRVDGNSRQNLDSWYVTGGVRLNQFTPYATYRKVDPKTPTTAEEGFSAGLRWDAWRNIAVKVQYDLVALGDGSVGSFINRQPGFEVGGDTNVFSLTVDFVY